MVEVALEAARREQHAHLRRLVRRVEVLRVALRPRQADHAVALRNSGYRLHQHHVVVNLTMVELTSVDIWQVPCYLPGGEFDCSVEKSVDFSVEYLSLIN